MQMSDCKLIEANRQRFPDTRPEGQQPLALHKESEVFKDFLLSFLIARFD